MKRYELGNIRHLLPMGPHLDALTIILTAQEVLSAGTWVVDKTIRRLDFLFHEFTSQNGGLKDGLEALGALNSFFFENHGFEITTDEKALPEDFFLGKVLESKNGSALAFSLIYRELGRKINLSPINLVNFPGFSFIKIFYQHQLHFVDPADRGRLLSVSELQAKLQNRYGASLVLNSTFLETPSELHVVHRILTKLKNLYFDLRQWEKLLAVLDVLVCINPAKVHELKERGLLLYQLGLEQEALQDLQQFVSRARPSDETEKLKRLVKHLHHPNVTPLFE